MFDQAWCENFNGAVTVCSPEGIIIYMNRKACQLWTKDGGQELLGKNLLACHPLPAREMLEEMLQKQSSNCYTVEKNGVKKLIYQTPVYGENQQYAGFMEISFELPDNMAHFIR